MTSTQAMLEAHPEPSFHVDLEALSACIRACHDCAQACAVI
jgi:hypothetical protein